MKPFVLSMKYPGFPVVEFRMINHRITHIFRKRTQNEQKNYCCIDLSVEIHIFELRKGVMLPVCRPFVWTGV